MKILRKQRGNNNEETNYNRCRRCRNYSQRFIDIWRRAERGEKIEEKQRLYFENLEMLLKKLASGRWVLLKIVRENGPMSIRCSVKSSVKFR